MISPVDNALVSFIALSKDGEWGKSEPFDDSVQMRIIRGTDFAAVREGDWSSVPVRYVSRKHASLKSVKDEDILIETAGGSRDRPTGRTIYLRPGTLAGQSLPVTCASFARFIRLDPDLVEPAFVYWWLQKLYGTGELLAFHTQHTGVARFQWTVCARSLVVPLLERSTQRKTATGLQAYDDLIENNHRRIKVLEEMAQRIYREWFVEFRYPGHENVPLIDSELGPIPTGWERGTLEDLVVLQRGFDLPKTLREEGSVPVMAASGPHGTHSRAKVCGPGVVTGRSGSLGHVEYVAQDFWPLNTTLWVKGFRRATPELGYYLLRNLDLAAYNSGAAVPTLNRNDIKGLPSVLPPHALVRSFSVMAKDLLDLQRVLRGINATASATRDLLLPRLISGEVDVAELDTEMPDLAVA